MKRLTRCDLLKALKSSKPVSSGKWQKKKSESARGLTSCSIYTSAGPITWLHGSYLPPNGTQYAVTSMPLSSS